jgi:hypothetical protein
MELFFPFTLRIPQVNESAVMHLQPEERQERDEKGAQ